MGCRWSKAQMRDLDWARRHHPVAHLRVKALALWNWGEGRPIVAVAACVGATRQSVRTWIRRYQAEGLSGLAVRPGRGRRSRVDPAGVARALEQSPRAFGLTQERWTLAALRQAVPSLRHLRSLRSVGYVMARLGLAPKRGQYRRQSTGAPRLAVGDDPGTIPTACRGGWGARLSPVRRRGLKAPCPHSCGIEDSGFSTR